MFIFINLNINTPAEFLMSMLAMFIMITPVGAWVAEIATMLVALLTPILLLVWFMTWMLPAWLVDSTVAFVDRVLRTRTPGSVARFFAEHPIGSFMGSAYQSRRNRERVTASLHTLHRESYRSAEELGRLSASELREIVRLRGWTVDKGVVEKTELVKALELTDPCSICLDTWHPSDDPGQQAQFLKCRHVFHVDCIQQWVASAGELGTRPVACPYCNTPMA
eukprot:m.206623 g.206623  ORF g.206623 m.206623 type:complete len:222 (-) comp23422_c0_seq1:85-750(-)